MLFKSMTNVLGFLGATKGGDPLPMRQAEVNRILGKVDELAVSDERNEYSLCSWRIC